MRILGIDYGDSRIGLALSDSLLITAQPYKTIFVDNGWKNAIPVIHDIIRGMDVGKVVIGYPISLDGTKNKRCEVTDRFIEVFSKGIEDIEIVRWDERYTTNQSKEILGKRSGDKGKRDIVAAALILRSYLDFCGK